MSTCSSQLLETDHAKHFQKTDINCRNLGAHTQDRRFQSNKSISINSPPGRKRSHPRRTNFNSLARFLLRGLPFSPYHLLLENSYPPLKTLPRYQAPLSPPRVNHCLSPSEPGTSLSHEKNWLCYALYVVYLRKFFKKRRCLLSPFYRERN